MTDSAANTPVPPQQPPAGKPPRRRKWWRRLKIAVVVLVLLVLAMRLAVYLLLPGAVRKAAAYYDLDAAFERHELKLVGGDAALWHLTLTPKSGGPPVLSTDYVRGDVSVLSLLRGRLDVWRAEADGVELLVERESDGRIPWLERLTATSAKKAAPPPKAKAPTTRPVDLAAPFKMDALRLQHVRARIVDRSVTPPFQTEVAMDVRLSDVGSSRRPTKFEMDVASPPVLDSLFVQGEGWATGGSVDADLRARVRGLRPRNAATYLKPLGLAADASEITGDFTGRVQLASRPGESNSVGVSLALQGMRLAADGADAAAVRSVVLTAPRLSPAQAVVDQLIVDGVVLNAGRTPDGFLHAAGLRLLPKPPTAAAKPHSPPRVPTTQPTTPLRADVDQVVVRDVRFTFDDRAVAPPTQLGFVLDQLLLKRVRFDPAAPTPLNVDGTFHLPGIARAGKLTGQVQPFGDARLAKLTVELAGIRPDALAPYLAPLGLESTFRDGTASLALDVAAVSEPAGDLVIDAAAQNIQLRDGPSAPLAKLDRARVARLRLSPARDHISVQSIEVTGPTTSIRRDRSGAIAALGLRTRPPARAHPSPATAPTAAAAATTTMAASPLPKIEIGHFLWSGTKVDLTDETVTPRASVTINDAGIELRDILFDPKADPAISPQPGQFRAWLAAPPVAKRLAAEGTIAPRPRGASFDCQLSGEAMSFDPLAPYIRLVGFDPVLRSGSLRGRVRGDVAITADGLAASSLRADNFHYADGRTELVGVDSLVIERARLTPTELQLPNIEVVRPRVVIGRDAAGLLTFGGVKLVQTEQVPTRKNATLFGHVVVKDGTFPWTDNAVRPALQATAHVNAEVSNLTLHRLDPPGDVRATLRVDDVVDALTVAGKVVPYADAPSAAIDVTATGLHAGKLVPYLPAGIHPELTDGRLRASVDAALAPNKNGGQSAHLIVSNVDYRDGPRDPALLRLDSARVIVPRIDVPAKVVAADEVSVAGLETRARVAADGRLHALGVALGQASEPPPAPNRPAAVPSTEPSQTGLKELTAKRTPPSLMVRRLDVNVRRFDFADERRAGAAPVAIRDLRFVAKSPIDWGGQDADSKPPTRFQLAMAVDPVARQVTTDFQVAPLAAEPSLVADLSAKGINGPGLVRVVPELAEKIDPSAIRDGEFRAHVESRLRAARRDGMMPDLSRPFDAELLVSGVAFRAQPGGAVVLGVDEVRADNIRVDPPAQRIVVSSLEVTKPIARMDRAKEGVRVAEVLVRPPPARGEAVPAAATIPPERPGLAPQAGTVARPKGEIRIDKLTVTGIDVVAEDKTTSPPLIVPLEGLDVEASDLSSRAMYEDRPIRFNALVNAGKVPIRNPKTGQLESKELFSQATATGLISLYPKPKGWAKTSVTGLELGALSGPAKAKGVTIGGGVFDANVDARFRPTGAIDTRSKFVFNDLKLSEAPNGPITRALKLPAPIDVVIAAMEDPGGSITVPISVPVEHGNVRGVAPAAAGAAAGVIATAVASSPLKAGGAVTGVLGLGGDTDKEQAGAKTVELTFPAGDAGLAGSSATVLAGVINLMRQDPTAEVTVRHSLGPGDIKVVGERVNPSAAEAAALAERVRAQKADLLRLREETAARARGQLAAGSEAAAAASLDALRSIDTEIAQGDDGMDRLYDLVRPGAERQAPRRTRTGCVELAKERLDAVHANLLAAGLPKADARVHMTPPRFDTPAPDAPPGGGRITLTIVSKGKR